MGALHASWMRTHLTEWDSFQDGLRFSLRFWRKFKFESNYNFTSLQLRLDEDYNLDLP